MIDQSKQRFTGVPENLRHDSKEYDGTNSETDQGNLTHHIGDNPYSTAGAKPISAYRKTNGKVSISHAVDMQ